MRGLVAGLALSAGADVPANLKVEGVRAIPSHSVEAAAPCLDSRSVQLRAGIR
jgi:hypothetical protein